jgi:hypothetical protein
MEGDMKRAGWVVGLCAAVGALPAWALDIEPVSRQKAIAAAVTLTPTASIPASAAPGREIELPELRGSVGVGGRAVSGPCSGDGSDLCYDFKERRLVYRPARNWMPEISGLTPENISVRRDAVVFKYSFR